MTPRPAPHVPVPLPDSARSPERAAEPARRPTTATVSAALRRALPVTPVMREIPAAPADADATPQDLTPGETAGETPRETPGARSGAAVVARFLAEADLADDVRSALASADPNRREAWAGWAEHRTRTAGLSVTVSWADRFARGDDRRFVVPHLAAVLEALLVGAAADQDDLTVADECDLYRAVVGDLARRIDAIEACYA